MKHRPVPAIVVLLTLLISGVVTTGKAHARQATTGQIFHVAVGGNDQNDGSEEAPWATLQHAAEQVGPGDTVWVHPGTYTGFQIEQSGTLEQPIVFKATGDDVVIDEENPVRGEDHINVEGAGYVVIEGFRVRHAARAGIRVVEARGVVVKHNVVGPNGKWGIFTGFAPEVQILYNETFGSVEEHGIYVSNSRVAGDAPVIRGNLSYDNGANGIQLNGDCYVGGDGVLEEALIEDNVVWGNGYKGLSLISIAASTVRNNVIYENGLKAGAGGIHLVDEPGCGLPTTETVVVNNTIVEPRIAGIRASDGATANVIFNNLIVSDRPIRDEVGGNHVDVTSNLTLAASDGLFLDPASGDYHLAPGSAAIDAGTATYRDVAAPAYDRDGVTRPPQGVRPDAGAYEAPVPTRRDPDGHRPPPAGAPVLEAFYPNPFPGRAQAVLRVHEPQRVTVMLYDALGRRVAVMFDGIVPAGQRRIVPLEAEGLPAGTYVVRATGETFVETWRVVITP